MANENKFEEILKTSFDSIKNMLDSNTVMGNPIDTASGTTIIPISKISVGFATGGVDSAAKKDEANQSNKQGAKFGGGGGSGMSIKPVGFLVVDKNGRTEFISVDATPANDPIEQISDLLDRSPEIIEKIKNLFSKKEKEESDVVVEEIITEE